MTRLGIIGIVGLALLWTLLLPTATEAAESELLNWQELPALPDEEGFAGMYAGTSHGALIAGGGANFPDALPWEGGEKVWYDTIYVLESPQDQWRVAENKLPRPLAYGVSMTVGDRVICIGGDDGQRHYADVFALEWINGDVRITDLPPLPQPCSSMAGAAIDNVLYVAGGLSEPGATQAMHNFWRLDLSVPREEQAWEVLNAWPGPGRFQAVAGVQGDSLYLFSGIELEAGPEGQPQRITPYLSDAYRYTPDEGWAKLADMPRPAAAAPGLALPVGQSHLALLGGLDGSLLGSDPATHPGFPEAILAYHVPSDSWVEAGAMPEEAGRVTAPVIRWQERWAVISGERAPGRRSPQVFSATQAHRQVSFGLLNWTVLGVYLLGMVGIGLYCSRRESSTSEFFLAGQRIPWWAAGLSIYGTQLSAITFMAIPATAFAGDWVRIVGNWLILLAVWVVVAFYLPFYRRLNLTTAYAYLEHRFGLSVRLVGSAAFLLFQLGRMGIVLFLPALALSAVTGIDIYLCIALMGLLATIYTVLGGIEAVIWTDVVQVIILLGGALACLGMILVEVGGFGPLWNTAYAAGKLNLANLGWDPTQMVLWVMVVGMFFGNLVPYTADQAVVQRYLTTRDERQAARSLWTSGLLAIPTGFLFFGLGTALWMFYREQAALAVPVKSDQIVPWFVVHQLPAGVAGLVVAGIFAAAMSSLDSSMNSMATAITNDWYQRLRSGVTDRQALSLAKWLTIGLGVLGTASAMLMAAMPIQSLFDAFNAIIGLLGGGLAGMFLLGIFTRRTSSAGALAGMAISSGLLVYVAFFTQIHVFLYAAIGVVTCVIAGYLLSLLIPNTRNIAGLTVRSSGSATNEPVWSPDHEYYRE